MSNPMLSEKCESSSKSSSNRRELKRRERKMWKKPIKISRLPSFGFSGSDFKFDQNQIPTIFSGYTAESEDSSSSDMSDDSRTYSKSSSHENNEEIDQERLRSVRRQVLRRQSTRKYSGGGVTQMRLKKMKSMKRIMKKKNLDSVSREGDLGFLEPHYLRPTSSSASKNVEKIQKVARLKRISSLRYNGLLKATCSSAMKGSKKSNDVCNYRYCSLHGRVHSHGADNNSVVVPSLKRFVSMRRKFMKRQKSANRRLVLLKRTLSRKRGPLGGGLVVSDQESNQEEFEEEVPSSENGGNDSEPTGKASETVLVDVDDNVDGGMDSIESKPEIMDDLEKNTVHWHGISEQNLMGLDHDGGTVEGTKNEETVEDNEVVCREGSSREMGEKKTVNAWNDKESKSEIMDDDLDGRMKESNIAGLDYDDGKAEGKKSEETVGNNVEEDATNTENVWNETVTLVKQAFDEILAEITDDDDSSDDISVTKNDIFKGELAKEDDVGADSSDSTSSDLEPIEEMDTHLSVIVSTSHKGEESDHRRGAKKWSYLKRVILLKRFLKSLDRKERHKLSDGEEREKIMRLRRELVGERKNADEWMLDHALRQVISTLAPSQKRKVKHLVKAFESLTPMDGGCSRDHDDLGSPRREDIETVNSETMILREYIDTTDQLEAVPEKDLEETVNSEMDNDGSRSHDDLGNPGTEEIETVISETILRDDNDTTDQLEVLSEKETKLTNEALEPNADASSSHHLAMEEELDVLASCSSIEVEEEKTGDSEKQNLSTWRNLIQKQMVIRDNSEQTGDGTEQEDKKFYGTDEMRGIEEDGDAAERQSRAVKLFQEAFEKILSEIPDDVEVVSVSSKEDQGETKRSWNSLRKVILLKRFVKSLDKVRVFNPRKLRNLPVESVLEAENVLLRHRSELERRRTDGEEMMLDYALRQAISRLAPIQRKKVELLVQAFDTVLDGNETPKHSKNSDTPRKKDETIEEGTPKVEDEQRIKSVFARFQVNQKDLKGEEEVDSTPTKESRNLLPPIKNVKQRIVVEKGKDSKLWKLIYKHMVTEKEGTDSASIEGEGDDEANGLEIDARRSGTVTLVREALEKILCEIPDNSSDDQSMDSDITTDQELFERNSQVSEEPVTFKPKRVKGWNNVKKVILLKRFVSDLGSLTRLSPKTPRVLPWEPDPETEKIRLRHQETGGKRNSEEWMLDYALRQAISTLAPSQKRKVTLLAQAFDTISLQDIGSGSTPSSAVSSRNISRQSSISFTPVHRENEVNAEMIRGRLMNLQEELKETRKLDDTEEKQQCSGLWRLLCKQMEDNERNQTLPEETIKEEHEEEVSKEETNMEHYETEAVDLLGEVIDGITLEESHQDQRIETLPRVRSNRWSNLKRMILLRRFVKALENVRKFNPREPRYLPLDPEVEAEKVNLRHQETQNKRNGEEWMVDNALQGVVSKLTPARKLKVQLLVQAFESLSATGN